MIKKDSIFKISLFLSIFIFAIGSSFTLKKEFSIDGAWRLAEVQTVMPNGTVTSVFPTESIALFAGNYYSLCWTSHSSAHRNWQMSDSLKLVRFNKSIINSDTFQLKDSVLITKASFAMNPMFTDGLAKFKCSFKGDTLVLTGISVFSSDNIAHPAYANGVHFVSKLVKIKN